MAKNIRKLFAEIDKNLKCIDEVLFAISNFKLVIGYINTGVTGIEAIKCTNSDDEGKVWARHEKGNQEATETERVFQVIDE